MSDQKPSIDPAVMPQEVDALYRRFLSLHSRLEMSRGQMAALEKEVGIAKARGARKEDVDGVLDAVEQRFHAKSMGVLESLLTAFLNDVLPREFSTQQQEAGVQQGTEQSVRMRLETRRNVPALDVSVCSGDQEEDAMRGRGGSVANVLSTGLRLIAMARSGPEFRPFLVLDEADCWIRPDRVAAFSDELLTLSNELGIQILYVSHHDRSVLSGFPVELRRTMDTDGYPGVSVSHAPLSAGSVAKPYGGHDALVALRLENFLSHRDTSIPLVAHVTVVSGVNDVGKSAIVEAFRALAYNDCPDTLMRHGAPFMRVTATLRSADGQEQHIQWERVRKGSPKVFYRLLDAKMAIVRETPSPKDVPDWVQSMLGISMRDTLDVQIGDQKRPVFLLDETPAQRAAILDIGRESQHLRNLRERWKAQVDTDRRTVREGEKRLRYLSLLCETLSPVDAFLESVELLRGRVDSCLKHGRTLDGADLQWHRAAHARAVQQVWRRESSVGLFSGFRSWEPGQWMKSMRDQERGEDALRSAARSAALRDIWTERAPLLRSASGIRLPDTAGLQAIMDGQRSLESISKVSARMDVWRNHEPMASPAIPVTAQDLYALRARWDGTVHASDFLKSRMPALAYLREWLPVIRAGMDRMMYPVQQAQEHMSRMRDGFEAGKSLMECTNRMDASQQEKHQVLVEKSAIEQKEKRCMEEWGRCPYCGAASGEDSLGHAVHRNHKEIAV